MCKSCIPPDTDVTYLNYCNYCRNAKTAISYDTDVAFLVLDVPKSQCLTVKLLAPFLHLSKSMNRNATNEGNKMETERTVYRTMGKEFDTAASAIAYAYSELAEQTGKPGWKWGTSVERVAIHEPRREDTIFSKHADPITETVTARIKIDAPGTLAREMATGQFNIK